MTWSQELCCSHYRTYAATTETVPKTSRIFIFSEKRQGFEHALHAPQVPLSFAVHCGVEHDHVTVMEVNSKRLNPGPRQFNGWTLNAHFTFRATLLQAMRPCI